MRPYWCGVLVLLLCASDLAAREERETLDRGLVGRPVAEGGVYLGWRLLESDPKDVAFNVYRRTGTAEAVKLNAAPIAKTTDFVDDAAPKGAEHAWFVRPVVDGKEGPASGEVRVTPGSKDAKPYLPIPSGNCSSARGSATTAVIGTLAGSRGRWWPSSTSWATGGKKSSPASPASCGSTLPRSPPPTAGPA